jgi:hypothetical protein
MGFIRGTYMDRYMMKKMTPSNGQKGQLLRWLVPVLCGRGPTFLAYSNDPLLQWRQNHPITGTCSPFWRTNDPPTGPTPAPATTSVPSWGKLPKSAQSSNPKNWRSLRVFGSWILTRNQSRCMLERMPIIRVAVRYQPVIVVPALFKSGRRYESL